MNAHYQQQVFEYIHNCSFDEEYGLGKHYRVYAQHTHKHIYLLLFLVYFSYLIVAVAQNGCC